MFEIIAAVLVFVAAVFAMSLGAIFGNRPLKGSCGGLNNLKKLIGLTPCGACPQPHVDCPLRRRRMAQGPATETGAEPTDRTGMSE